MVNVRSKNPLDLNEKMNTGNSRSITPADAVTAIVSKLAGNYEENKVSELPLKLLSIMWDNGFNSFAKIDQAVNMLVNNYHAGNDMEQTTKDTYSLIDDAKPELNYNPFALKLEFIKLMPILGRRFIEKEETIAMLRYLENACPDSPILAMMYAFSYGVMSGKRAERRRRAKQ